VVISSPDPTRDTRPATPGQAAALPAGQPAREEDTGTHGPTSDSLLWRVRPGMATPARQRDDHNAPLSREPESEAKILLLRIFYE
jgi:hypothetical protein